jgi:hypothetical protein
MRAALLGIVIALVLVLALHFVGHAAVNHPADPTPIKNDWS